MTTDSHSYKDTPECLITRKHTYLTRTKKTYRNATHQQECINFRTDIMSQSILLQLFICFHLLHVHACVHDVCVYLSV